ncbi:hypothetical protein CHS0354_004948 [Potamilus streckersoni]|uniref:Tenascin-X n=1 Tax=Potamilus streckersoni TaxID=2493646 RepID=A0AAE0RNK1_9BIVA|nr:hypothetical protein CHS0354_004948 [Potamilus streckersoni]
MMDLSYTRIDKILFKTINIRNRGSLHMDNREAQHILDGRSLHVYPGGLLKAKNLLVTAENVTIDVMGAVEADHTGFCNNEGPGAGFRIDSYGTGGSHGGEGGSESAVHMAPPAYGFFIEPHQFGSGGGDGSEGRGGCGGGILVFNHVNSTVTVDGRLSANGENGGTTSGGGSGGSIHVICHEFDGSNTGIVQVTGGSGRNGGAGGRLAVEYKIKHFIGDLKSEGGQGLKGENGAAGTIFTKDHGSGGTKTLMIYNMRGKGQSTVSTQDRKTKITLPENKTEDYDMDIMDLGDYAQVGLLATDSAGNPSNGSRALKLTHVQGDHTATIHVEKGMKLNIDFNASAVLSFNIVLYEEASVNLPYDTYLRDSSVILYGGILESLNTLNISLNGAFILYPPARLNKTQSDRSSTLYLNSISILDGGVFRYEGTPQNNDELRIVLDGGLVIRGGGELHANKLHLTAVNITVDTEGLVNASNQGWPPNSGPGAGVSNSQGSSGGSHGGLGGMGSGVSYAGLAYGKLHSPMDYGSGGGAGSTVKDSGLGGGVVYMEARNVFEMDGIIMADGGDAEANDVGGGSGGSILLKAGSFIGTGKVSASGGAGSCVPNCAQCDGERRCLQCQQYYYWQSYRCSTSPIQTPPLVVGGGGGGGRIAVYAKNSYQFRGTYQTYGGNGFYEQGGSGTVFTMVPNGSGGNISTVTIDNNGYSPRNQYITNRLQDSMRTYIITYDDDTNSTMTFDHVNILGKGHLAFRNMTPAPVQITIRNFHGDKSGMLHTSVDQNIIIKDGDVPFPASFRVYDASNITLPADIQLTDLTYKTIYMDGIIDGVRKLSVGRGVNFFIGNKGHYKNHDLLHFGLESLEIYADGKLSSSYLNEHKPSLSLQIDKQLRLHSGSRIETPWLEVSADTIQVDVAGIIDTSGRAMSDIYQSGISTIRGGGSGGGNGAAGGQAAEQRVVGSPPSYGSLYTPLEYGGNGGSGGGDPHDLKCGSSVLNVGGKGGGVINLRVNRNLTLDGELRSDGKLGSGAMAGGGAGGSIYIVTKEFHGEGVITVIGGSIAGGATCLGGGGGGGRVAIHYEMSTFGGSVYSHGGHGYECGGAGTVLWRQLLNGGHSDRLFVDNKDLCVPKSSHIDWGILSDAHRGEHSFHTWLYDPRNIANIVANNGTFTHEFNEIHLSGQAQLALHRRNIDSYKQFIVIHKTTGLKNGMFHIGQYQEILAKLPPDSPELKFGLVVYPGGTMRAEKTLLINSITLEMEGLLSGVENLIIGPKGKVILRPFGNSTILRTSEITFSGVTVQGGGKLVIDSNSNGMIFRGDSLKIESGGVLETDKLEIFIQELEVEDSGIITADGKSRQFNGGLGVGVNGAGAGHGGQGGKGSYTNAGGMFYGHTTKPTDFGSNGRKSNLFGEGFIEIYGGGVITMHINKSARIDGTIQCNGGNGDGGSGGASGGSILLETTWLYGKGVLQVNGGKGSDQTGGGSGGRLAVYYQHEEFTGTYTAYGGDSGSGVGAAGTVYVESAGTKILVIDNRRPHTVKHIISNFDQEGLARSDSSRTWVTFQDDTSLHLDVVYLQNGAHLGLEPTRNVSQPHHFDIRVLKGNNYINQKDLTGTLHIGPHHLVSISNVDLYMPANVLVYENGTLELPPKVKWYNTLNHVWGVLRGVQEVTLVHSGLNLYSTSRTEGDNSAASYHFTSIEILADSAMTLISKVATDVFSLSAQRVFLGATGKLHASNLVIEANTLETEDGAVIDLDGQGYTASGPGYWPNMAGASHGGYGGHPSGTEQTGSCYDYFRHPTLPGSGGKNSKGGGVLQLDASSVIHDGVIMARGSSGSSDSGGGAGGSVWISADTLQITGKIHVDGGSGSTNTKVSPYTGGGGGGGGLLALIYSSGHIEGHLTAYGGVAGYGAQAGAAGIIYTEQRDLYQTFSKALIKNFLTTSAVSTLVVPESVANIELDQLQIEGNATVGFKPRSSNLRVELARIARNPSAILQVDKFVEVYLTTRSSSISDKLILNTSIYVAEHGTIDLPQLIVIEQGVILEICGSLTTNTRDILVRNNGYLKISYPGASGILQLETESVLNLHSLAIDYEGHLGPSSRCFPTSKKVILSLKYFNHTSDFHLDNSINLSSGYETVNLSIVGEPLNRTCPPDSNLVLLRKQYCYLYPGDYTFNSITVESGAELRLEGEQYGQNKTKITANIITVKSNSRIAGNGTGHQFSGQGESTAANMGATHGGNGVRNIAASYGSITNPTSYGSNGYHATHLSGRGGGQIELIVKEELILDGEIDMSGGDSPTSGGSGGSIKVVTNSLSGSGAILAEGGSGGGGGGRIAVTVNGTNSFSGRISAKGGKLNRDQGSAGTIYLNENGLKRLIISGPSSEKTVITINSDLDTTSWLLELRDGTICEIQQNISLHEFYSAGSGEMLVIGPNSHVTIQNFTNEYSGSHCNLIIESAGKLVHRGTLYVSGNSPKLEVKEGAIVDADKLVIGNDGILTVASTGKIQVSDLHINEGSQIKLQRGSYMGLAQGRVNLHSIHLGYNSTMSFSDENITIDVKSFEMDPMSAIDLLASIKEIHISADNIKIQDGAVVLASGGGNITGPGRGLGTSGASYGGEGGGNSGTIYGSTDNPTELGSGTSFSRGGGIITLNGQNMVDLDGTLAVDGSNGDSTYGGASGGSIIIKAEALRGHGHIYSRGGKGTVTTAGGGGGRIAIHVGSISNFYGDIVASGGEGSTNGAAGTVYQSYTISGASKKKLIVDNSHQESNSNTVITNMSFISELELTGNARVLFNTSHLFVESIDGDYSGKFTVQKGQEVNIATMYGTQHAYGLKCKLVVASGGTATLPAKLLLKDEEKSSLDELNLNVQGTVLGLRDLTVAAGGIASFGHDSRSGLDKNKLDDESTLVLNNLDVTTFGTILLGMDSSSVYTLSLRDELNIKYGAVLKGMNLDITSPKLQVAYSGMLHVNEGGNPSQTGIGAGAHGSGASFGGAGGTSHSGTSPSLSFYGSFTTVTEAGSGGGNTSSGGTGGHGGGILHISVTEHLILNGIISSDGGPGLSGGGGGTGGSVAIITVDMSGAGSISVHGGDSDSGGGGGGGRVVLDVMGVYNFSGSQNLKGGSSKTGGAGGSGTVYLKTIVNNLPNFELKVSNMGTSGTKQGHTYIDYRHSPKISVDKLDIGTNTVLNFVTSGLYFEAEILTCELGSTVIVHDYVIFSADINMDYTKPRCSFNIRQEGELRLPNKVELLGASNSFDGTLTNIRDLIISSHQEATFSAKTKTASFANGKYTYRSLPGAYRFSTFTIKDHAKVKFEATGQLQQLGKLELHYRAVLFGEKLLLWSNYIIIHPGSVMNLTGRGHPASTGPGHGQMVSGIGTGGGHGAAGGSTSEATPGGSHYGLTRDPIQMGSGGGNSTSAGIGGSGGGLVNITLETGLSIEGSILVNGENGNGVNAGGGSGGTVTINTPMIIGSGLIASNGGKGSGKGGGGAGGRIKINARTSYDFTGTLTAYGGGNDDNLNTVKAGPGTVYIQKGADVLSVPEQHLIITGDTTDPVQKQTRTQISGTTRKDFQYDFLTLKGYAHTEVQGLTTIFILAKIHGDKTAWLYMRDKQILQAEFTEGIQNHFVTNINIKVDAEATLHVPLDLTVGGTMLDLSGQVTFNKLIVEDQGIVLQHSSSFTASYAQGRYTATSQPGIYALNYISLKHGSAFKPTIGLQLQVDMMEMKRYVKLYAEFIEITAGTLVLERGAQLNVVGKGNPADVPASAHGQGKNGGSHASSGGIGDGKNLTSASEPYGTIYKPIKPGAPGGSGGNGGGYIYIRVDELLLDGIIDASGATSSTGGGGSGGSIYVICEDILKGLGLMAANGGDASSSDAGGGSGGHIAVETKEDFYQGKYSASGGVSDATYGKGGPGSIYLKRMFSTGTSDKLIIDNKNGQKTFYATLNETSANLKFDEVDIYNYAKFQVVKDGVRRDLNIRRVNGDGTGLLRMQTNQVGTLERIEFGASTKSKLEINLELHDGGEFILSETTTILGKADVALDLDGIMRGVINLILGPNRVMRMGRNAVIVPIKQTSLSSQARVTFGMLQLDPGSSLEYDPDSGADMLVGTLNVKFASKITADYFNISCSKMDIELEAKLSAASTDRAKSNIADISIGSGKIISLNTGGAGHGGVGGGSKDVAGLSYGSLYKPTYPGSRTGILGGKGGGKIFIKVGDNIFNDGEISVNGSTSANGGGSGGSIYIEAYTIDGFGRFSSVGGSGTGTSGGGSAGRVAIYSRAKNGFEGDYLVFGGNGASDIQAGGGGTVYLEDIRNNIPYKCLLLDNMNHPVDKYATIDEEGIYEHNFHEVHVMNKASIQMSGNGLSVKMNIRKLFGDGSGLIHLHSNQVLIAEYKEASRNAFISGVNFALDEGSEIILPSITYIYGDGVQLNDYTEKRSINLHGRFTGVLYLVLGYESQFFLGPKSHTAVLGNGTYSRLDSEGEISFGSVDLRSFSSIKTVPDMTLKITAARIDSRYKSVLSAESISLQASVLNVEAGSKMTTSAVDRPGDTLDSSLGQGSSESTAYKTATGAGHATTGGGNFDSNYTAHPHNGRYYGSLYQPKERGSAGGQSYHGASGKGGGVIDLSIGLHLLVDGTLTVDASPGGLYAGGGSGGSISIRSPVLEGHGVLSAVGGDGACGGAGGRIMVNLTSEIYFHGDFKALGGSGSSNFIMSSGGPGSVYIQDTRHGLSHKQLLLDNLGRSWNYYYTLDEGTDTLYSFDEVSLVRNASLQIKTGHQQKKSLVVQKIHGDKTGRIHLRANQTAYLEEYQPQTKTPINLWVEDGAQVYLSPLVYILGLGEIAFNWNGEIIGVRHLRIVPGRRINIGPMAQTSIYQNGSYLEGVPGWFRFSSMELGANAVIGLPPPMSLKLTVGILDLKYNSEFKADMFIVEATDFYLEPLARLVCSGTASLVGKGHPVIKEAGAGHASAGGNGLTSKDKGGDAYGSLYEPTDPGSKGGGISGGRGGGALKLTVPAIFQLDGYISADGATGTDNSGGGSGGSVYIRAGHFRGHGKVSATGGQGHGSAGGGSGGRIAVHTLSSSEYRGFLVANGEKGTTTGDRGGPGSVFVEDRQGPYTWQSRLYIDGKSLKPAKPLVILERNPRHVTAGVINDNNGDLDFDHLLLQNEALLQIAEGSDNITSINLDLILGDGSGVLHMQSGQSFYIEYDEYSILRSSPPVRYDVDHGAKMYASADLRLIGKHQPVLRLGGHLAGVMNLTLEEGRVVQIGENATNSRIKDGKHVILDNGTLVLSKLSLQANAKLNYQVGRFQLDVSEVMMRHGSKISADILSMSVSTLHLAGEATLDVSARGGTGRTENQGYTLNNIGTGAGHGGYGGGANLHNYTQGKPYGSYKTPHDTGSSGGGTAGGLGGGIITLNVAQSLHCDGVISSLGGDATENNSGGGSGGSIYIVTTNFSGHGLITTEGGDGYVLGFGGAGGRIAVHVAWFKEYTGDFVAYGGLGGSGNTNEGKNGAAGTVYFTDSNTGLTGKKIINTTNGIQYEDGFTKLLINNDNRNHIVPTVVMSDTESNIFEFDQLDAYNHAVLWMDGGNSQLIVHKFDGDRTGLMHLLEGQILHVEYKESTTGYTVAPVSYKIEKGTEIRLPSTVIMLGTRTELKGLITNVHNLTIAEGANIVFHSTAQTALLEGGNFTHMTVPGNISFSHLTIQRSSLATLTDVTAGLVLHIIKVSIKYEGEMRLNRGTIYSDEGVVESLGFLSVDHMGYSAESGLGAGRTGIGGIGYGGSHGGHGGAPKPEFGGTPYDSVYKPEHAGSGGGNGGGVGGRGGGYLHWVNGKNLWIDGEVSAQGEAGQTGNGGGGSGGGILIKTLNFTGYGHLDCSGGNGSQQGSGGGGSGGRIAVQIGFSNKFTGRLNVVGGLGSGGVPSGAAGTVYLEETARGPQYADIKHDKFTNKTIVVATHRRLEISNDDIDKFRYSGHAEPWLYTVVNEDAEEYEFDEALLEKHANILFEYPKVSSNLTVTIHKFYGDRTGVLRLRKNQHLYVEVVYSVTNETVAPCSYIIEEGSEIIFPKIVSLLGTRTVLAGLITGVQELQIRGGADVVFNSTAHTALVENGIYKLITPQGNFSFSVLRVMRNSKAEFRQISVPMSITVSDFLVKYEGLLLMNFVELYSAYAHIESQGTFDMDGVGYGPEQGSGAGHTLLDGTGLGAGHGGWGGGPGPEYGGDPYNSIYRPMEPGSGGGNGAGVGGSGGGYLVWHIGDLLEMNGLLTLQGTAGSGGNAGGGSGGSVYLTATNITGHGVIAVNGANGVGKGGGGAGGRVSITCKLRYQYGGKFHNFGGNGAGRYFSSHAGASGTTYKEENSRELEYREKKFDKVLNTTILAVDRTYIHSDNWGIYSPAATLIQDPPRDSYKFYEMELTGSARMMIFHPDNVTKINVTVDYFLGDKTGQLHLKQNQTVFVEVIESVTNKTEAPCSFIIEYGATIVLPAIFHMLGTNSTLGGMIVNVHDLYIEYGAWAEFLSTATTALWENSKIFGISDEGNFNFGKLFIKLGGNAGFLQIEHEMSLNCSEIKVKYQGNLYMNDADLYSSFAWIESEGVFHLNGHGHGPEAGPGAGSIINNIGSGAGHGGYGGGSDPTQAAEPYGSVASPHEAGSGGGNGQGLGGKGGGILFWQVGQYIELNGLLALQGTDGQGTSAGGGSGGSLLIHTTNMTGHGEINVEGGDGSGLGGGGAGGRVGIHCRYRYSYGGLFTNHGGLGGTGHTASHGGAAGTTYVEENKRPQQYRILKYLHGTNNTYLQVDHR